MAVTETQRHDLHTHFQETMGRERAAVMMELLPPVGWGDVATKQDLTHLATREDLAYLKVDVMEKLTAHLLAVAGLNVTLFGLCVAVVTLLR